MVPGIILIIIGVGFLLQNLGYISGGVWNIIWPVILIVLGLSLIFRRPRAGFFWGERFGWEEKKLKTKKKHE
jgi:predicted permease